MIWLTKVDGSPIMVNDVQILFIEAQHDTVVSLSNGDKLRVLETPSQIAARVADWRRRTGGMLAMLEPEMEEQE